MRKNPIGTLSKTRSPAEYQGRLIGDLMRLRGEKFRCKIVLEALKMKDDKGRYFLTYFGKREPYDNRRRRT